MDLRFKKGVASEIIIPLATVAAAAATAAPNTSRYDSTSFFQNASLYFRVYSI